MLQTCTCNVNNKINITSVNEYRIWQIPIRCKQMQSIQLVQVGSEMILGSFQSPGTSLVYEYRLLTMEQINTTSLLYESSEIDAKYFPP